MRLRRLGMKKPLVALFALLFVLACLPSFGQATQGYAKDAYYKTVRIVKIWSTMLGYKIVYFTSKSQIAEFYVPATWFNKGPASKADLIYGNDPSYPYFSIFWIDGKFDHMRIHVLDDFKSATWGVLKSTDETAKLFDVQGPPLDF
jgi:hypothetical protein